MTRNLPALHICAFRLGMMICLSACSDSDGPPADSGDADATEDASRRDLPATDNGVDRADRRGDADERDRDAVATDDGSDPELGGGDQPDSEADGEGGDVISYSGGLSGRAEAVDGSTGGVILELTPVRVGGETVRFRAAVGEDVDIPELADGRYGLLAWLDEDEDDTWDGIWDGDGEPTARFGIELPRVGLTIVLRRGVPEPVLDANPDWLDLYGAAWELARDHIAAGTPENGFADHYLDEAFSDQIFQWDTCFMTLFGRYGLDAFPVMASLDNFYGVQRDDGFICRVANESDGLPCVPTESSEPKINPPLFGWSELLYLRQTGDLSRLRRVLPILDDYHDWLDENVRTEPGLYYTSMLGSGMDNAPRDEAYDGWVDITAQQALGRAVLAELFQSLGEITLAGPQDSEAERICGDVRTFMWDDSEGFFFDLDFEGQFLTDKTLASIWPLLAGCATADQARRVVEHLASPAEFWRVHVFPSTAADSPAYDPNGHYWRGGVWAPTNYATVVALSRVGRPDLARRASENHLTNLHRVLTDFVPEAGSLAADAVGDGCNTLWELYGPDDASPGTRWDATYLGRQDFVGWTGLGPIALLLEYVIGLAADAPNDTLTWHVTRTDRHGVLGYRFGDQLVDLVAKERSDTAAEVIIDITTSDPFTLVVVMGGHEQSFSVAAGDSTVEVSAADGHGALSLVPAGPFPGYAVLGNGQISAVYSDDDGTGDPPGITHLYYGDFGLDLVEQGSTVTVDGGVAGRRARVGTDPFFAAYTEAVLPRGGSAVWRAFVGAADAVIVHGSVRVDESARTVSVLPLVELREAPHIDGAVELISIEYDVTANVLWAEYADGTVLALGSNPAPATYEAGPIARPLTGGLTGTIDAGRRMALEVRLDGTLGAEVPFTWVVSVGADKAAAFAELAEVLAHDDPLTAAGEHWESWSPAEICGPGRLCDVAAANLYAARASSLAGQVPADLTGQFVTNGFPQLYPRDALMVARTFASVGQTDAAWEIVRYWLDDGWVRPRPGEWYARYDALGRAVDGGTGADYDVPEWDCNGYLAVLVEQLGADELSAAEREVLLEGLDRLVTEQDGDGLFTEGGIVEWVGRLPSTAMTVWAGLDAGIRLAESWGQSARALEYGEAAGKVRGGLIHLLDFDRKLLADERDDGLSYDTAALFGPVWGYPADPLLDSSYAWILAHATAHGGGVRYFDAPGYGHDLFFFTTSAAAEYAVTVGDTAAAERLIWWMTSFSNRYGLSPERVYEDGSGAAEASPLSWCAAELATAILTLRSATATPEPPTVDGIVSSREYRRLGPSVIDADGSVDEAGDPIALFANRIGTSLYLGLRVAGRSDGPDASHAYAFYLSDADGVGDAESSDGGVPLSFRCRPGEVAGASVRVDVDTDTSDCTYRQTGPSASPAEDCSAVVVGDRAIETHLDLASLDLPGPIQVIAAVTTADGDVLLPEHGSLQTDGADDTVLVTFEVDASSEAHRLNPDAGIVVTLSGDRAELGSWVGNALGLNDDGVWPDLTANDQTWTTAVRLSSRGQVTYKYLIGVPGDDSWEGVEFSGENRPLFVQDVNGTGRVRVADTFGVRGGELLDP